MSIQKALAVRQNMSIVPYNQNRALVPYVQDRVAGPSQSMNFFANLDFSRHKTTVKNVNVKSDMMIVLNMAKETQENMEQAKKAMDNTASKGNSFFSSLKEKALGIGEVVKKIGGFSLSGALETQKQISALQAVMGNKEVAKAYFEGLSKEADKSAYSVQDFVGVASQFMQVTKNTDKLDKLTNLSQRLAMIDPSQGLKGAGAAMREAMSGDFKSLSGKFGFDKTDIEILKASKSLDEFTNKFDQTLSKKGFTNQRLQEFNQSPDVQIKALKSNVSSGFEQMGGVALNALMPVITMLNQAFESGRFQPFFDGLSKGLSSVVQFISGAIDTFKRIGQVIQENWTIIGGILTFVAGALLGAFIQQLWVATTAILAQGVAWITAYWPIMLIVGAIALVIYMLKYLGVATSQIVGVIGAILGTLFAAIYNNIAFMWNQFASFAEFLINSFIDPGYAIQKLFYDITTNVLNSIKTMAKGLESFLNLIPGVEVDFTSGIENMISSLKKPTTDKKVINLTRMQQMDYDVAANFGYNVGADIGTKIDSGINGVKGMIDKMQNPTAQAINDQDKLLQNWNSQQNDNFNMGNDTLAKTKESVDISTEEIKMMVDLAEAESIQKNITLTPTVQVQTGDINQEVDVDSMIGKIAVALSSQAQISGSLLAEV